MHASDEFRATLHVLGYLFVRMGRTQSARRTFSALAELLPENAPREEARRIRRTLGHLAVAQGDGGAALRHLANAPDQDLPASGGPDAEDAALCLMRAQALWLLGRHDEARQHVRACAALSGERP